MRSYLVAFREYGIPSRDEVLAMLATAVAGGFIYSFDKWGNETFDLVMGIKNLILYTIMCFLLISAIEVGRRFFAVKLGYKTEFQVWWVAILISVFCVFFTRGWLKFLIPGGFFIKEIPHLRLGHFQYRLKIIDITKVALAGIMGGVFFTVALSGMVAWPITVMFMITIIASLVPIDVPLKIATESTPHSAGSAIVFGSRPALVFAIVLIAGSFILLKFLNFWMTMVLAIIIAAIGGFAYLWIKELKTDLD
jgi:hypothetical protein